MSLADRWHRTLEDLQAQGRLRRLTEPKGVDFSSNDYLGYGQQPWPPTAADLSRSGQASRLLRGHHRLWEQVETELASWHGGEAALMMNSGYSANEGLLSTLLQPGDFIASDQLNHASIIDGVRLGKAERFVFRHNDLDHLEAGLRQQRQSSAAPALFIVTEALFGMEGDRAPLREMADLAAKYQAHLIVDEAHSTGCFGPQGSGLVDELGLRDRVLATVHTGGKALGVCGAYICCSRLLRDVLLNSCRQLIFTTALPPIVASWWLAMLERVRADNASRQALHQAAAYFRAQLDQRGIKAGGSDYIVPVILGQDRVAVKAAEALQAAGLDIRAIRPPTVPPGTARLRISIHANHSLADLQRATAVFDTRNG
jgi:8-amino-7-oxononanoate synthase